jgi:hypothetical protein
MADTSERIIILSAILLAVIFIRSTQMYSLEPIYEIEIEIPENARGFWVDDDLIDPPEYWHRDPKVLYEKRPIMTPFIATAPQDQVDLRYQGVTRSLASVKKENKDIVATYVNPLNNTVFIVVHQLNESKKNSILNSLDKVEGVGVKFIHSARAVYYCRSGT